MRTSIFFLLLMFSRLQAVQVPAKHLFPDHSTIASPWFTGPLLAPSAANVPRGHVNFEPYIFARADSGHYDNDWKSVKEPTSWTNFFQPSVQMGVNNILEIDLIPTLFYNYNHGTSKWVYGDMLLAFAFQLFLTKRPVTEWNTALRLEVWGTIPFGQYQRLDPKKKGTDIGGQGSWRPGATLNWGNLFYLGGGHFATWRLDFIYTCSTPVRVHGLSTFGGEERTVGTVYTPHHFIIDTAVEISVTQNWVLVMEAVGDWKSKRRFKGITTAPVKEPAGIVYSLAPALEYNWNANIGLIFGAWFSVSGKNSPQFASAVIAFNYFK